MEVTDTGHQPPETPQETPMPAKNLPLEEMACEELQISIPCELAKRIRHYTSETGSDLSQVIIEALDTFLRGQNK